MIKLKESNNIFTIALDNKPVNALSTDFLSELSMLIAEISNQDKTRGVIFSTLLDNFCAGADLKERAIMSKEETIDTLYAIKTLFLSIYNLPFPTISIIQGACLGGGLELALSCDFRYCTKDAFFALPETRIGIIPGGGGTQLLPRIVGISQAKKMIYTGKKIVAEDAFAIGLVDKIVNKTNMESAPMDLLNLILKNSKISIASAKKSINKGFGIDLLSGLNMEFKEYIKTLDTKERQEALKKYLKS